MHTTQTDDVRLGSNRARTVSDFARANVPNILVVEDDPANRLLACRVLAENGYCVVEAVDGPAALEAFAGHTIDLVVLDLGLPGLDGLDVLARLRALSETPVMLVSARSAEHDRVSGLDAGADDYLVKPYSVAEFAARVRALLRRSDRGATTRVIEYDEMLIELDRHRITVRDIVVDLAPKEFAIVAFLASNAERAFSREALLEHVWGSHHGWQDQATVTEHVRRARVKLSRAGLTADPIETVRGLGYRFNRRT